MLHDFAADGVVYLELRTTPRALPKSGLSKAGYVEAILAVIREYEESSSSPLHTRLILSVDRRNTLEEAAEVVDLARRFQPQGVVGVDLCGDPLRGGVEALQPAFEAAHAVPNLGVTLHFAEAEASGSDAELLMMLHEWKPQRIGHVIHLSDTVKREVAAYPGGLGLELCLSCNVRAGMVSGGFEGHHFGEWCELSLVLVYVYICMTRCDVNAGLSTGKVEECTVVLCVSTQPYSSSLTHFPKFHGTLTRYRPTTWESSAARCPTSTGWWPSISASQSRRYAPWQGRA